MVMARVRKELYFNVKVNKEGRLTITGLKSSIPIPTLVEEKKKWHRYIFAEKRLDKILQGIHY
jgi:hypothetical protein